MTPCNSTSRDKRIGRLQVIAAAVFWSLSGPIAKVLTVDFTVMAFYRGLFAGLALLPFVPAEGRRFRPLFIPLCVIFGIMTLLYLASIHYTTAANAIFLQFTSVFWLIPLAIVFLKEKPEPRAWLGAGLAGAGVLGIVLFGEKTSREWLGIGLGLGSAIGYSLAVIAMRKLRDLNPFWLAGIANLGGALTLAVWFAIAKGGVPVPGVKMLLALCGFGVIQMAIPYMLFARALKSLDAPEAGLLSLLEPILNPIWVYLAVGEKPSVSTLIGGAFLLSGVLCRYAPFPVRAQDPGAGSSARGGRSRRPWSGFAFFRVRG